MSTIESDVYGRSVRNRPASFLVIDDEPAVREALADALAAPRRRIMQAGSVDEARALLKTTEIDIVVVDVNLPDGNGIDFAEQLKADERGIQSIVITGDATLPRAVQAIRAGVCDFLTKPLHLDELNGCVNRALQRHAADHRVAHRLDRLRQLCKKLHKARHQVTQQVDVLCNDLVSAYQELAEQMKHVQTATQFKTIIEQELELEPLLRTTLQYILKASGPANVVLFLPGAGAGSVPGEQSVGGYVNYSMDRSNIEFILDRFVAIVAPRVSDLTEPLELKSDAEMTTWLGESFPFIERSHVIALPCRHENENLAGMLLFRDTNEPLPEELLGTLTALAPVLGAQLVKLITIHHRLKDLEDDGMQA